MRHILKLAVFAFSLLFVTPAFTAGGVGCFGNKGSCGGNNGNGNGGNRGGGQKTWHKNGGGQNWHRPNFGGFKFKPPNRNDNDRRITRRDDRTFRRQPVIVDNSDQNYGRRDHYRRSGRTIIQQIFPQQGGGYYDDNRRWYRDNSGDNFIAGVATGSLIGVLGALTNQPAPPPDSERYYDDEQLTRFLPAPAAPAPAPVQVQAPAAVPQVIVKNNITINNSAPAKASANVSVETPDTMQAPAFYRQQVVTGSASKSITTDPDGNAVITYNTVEELCRAKNGKYFLGEDGLPKCQL